MTAQTFEFKDVTKRYGSVTALNAVSLGLLAGRHTAILGPSGCGKSTLLRLLAGLEEPTTGTILLNEQLASAPRRIIVPPHERGVAMVFQDLALWPNLTVRQNVQLGLSGLRVSRQELARRAREALELCGIAQLGDRLPSQLSGGQQQRAALARALAVKPNFLFLDEPFSGVDSETKSHILTEIAKLADTQQFTVILVSHDPWEALSLCREALVMQNGTFRTMGRLQELLASSQFEPFRSFRQVHEAYASILLRCKNEFHDDERHA
jgi:ABC-type Fe3+/spermidine/putrescine transport system ATPase subunit